MKLQIRVALFPRAILFAAIFAASMSGSFAKDAAALNYLKAGNPDATTLLAPPPLLDSPEQAADLDEVRAVSRSASSADKAEGTSEKSFTVFNFTGAAGPFLV